MKRIRQLRKQKKMTQKELAEHLQIADSTLSYWEMGKYEPDIDSLKKLSRFFLVPIDYIVGDEISEVGSEVEINNIMGIKSQFIYDSAATVAEPEVDYIINPERNAFNRDEFKGLTMFEVDKLAEYARFIKSLRAT